jgi:hypothetical protein
MAATAKARTVVKSMLMVVWFLVEEEGLMVDWLMVCEGCRCELMMSDDGQLSTSHCPSYTSRKQCVYRPSRDAKLACEGTDAAFVMEQTSRRQFQCPCSQSGTVPVKGDVDHDISASMLPLHMPQWLPRGREGR